MYDDGFENIINIDIADNVIDYMKKRNTSRTKMTCKSLVCFYFSLF